MIVLHQFPPALGLPNASPFCLKLELYLRMAELPYRNRYTLNVRGAPKGKLPWIDDEGSAVADSGMIIDYLKAKYGDTLDAALTDRERGMGIAVQRLVEEHLYWAVLHARWIDDGGWAITREAFFGGLPWPLRFVVPPLARRGMRVELHGHGLGRHAIADIQRLAVADLDALAALLGDQPWILGERPTSFDAVATGFLANILMVDLENPIKAAASRHANLDAYCRRVMARYFPA